MTCLSGVHTIKNANVLKQIFMSNTGWRIPEITHGAYYSSETSSIIIHGVDKADLVKSYEMRIGSIFKIEMCDSERIIVTYDKLVNLNIMSFGNDIGTFEELSQLIPGNLKYEVAMTRINFTMLDLLFETFSNIKDVPKNKMIKNGHRIKICDVESCLYHEFDPSGYTFRTYNLLTSSFETLRIDDFKTFMRDKYPHLKGDGVFVTIP